MSIGCPRDSRGRSSSFEIGDRKDFSEARELAARLRRGLGRGGADPASSAFGHTSDSQTVGQEPAPPKQQRAHQTAPSESTWRSGGMARSNALARAIDVNSPGSLRRR